MSAEAIIAIIALCVMVIGMFVGNAFWLLMMEQFDSGKPHLNLYSFFSSFNRRWDRRSEVFRQYRSLCPTGKLHIYERACLAVAMAGMITLVILGLIRIAS
jgi:hypothetical protein